jgi:hypothetical protein
MAQSLEASEMEPIRHKVMDGQGITFAGLNLMIQCRVAPIRRSGATVNRLCVLFCLTPESASRDQLTTDLIELDSFWRTILHYNS